MKTAPKVGKVSVLILEKLVLTGSDAGRHQLSSKSVLACNCNRHIVYNNNLVDLKVNGYKLIKFM